MCKMDMIKKIEELQSWENLMEEAKAEIESIKDTIKTEMLKENSEEMEVGKYIVRYTNVTSNRFDSASFKKALPEIYKIYLKQSAEDFPSVPNISFSLGSKNEPREESS